MVLRSTVNPVPLEDMLILKRDGPFLLTWLSPITGERVNQNGEVTQSLQLGSNIFVSKHTQIEASLEGLWDATPLHSRIKAALISILSPQNF